jgi:LysM repeat protein
MSSRTPRGSGQSTPKPTETDEAYPHLPEPKQSHTGSLLAFVSVLAVLGFGFWTALTTYMGTGDGKTVAKPAATVVATRVATASPAAAVAAATSTSSTPSAAPSGTPAAGAATAGPSGSKVHVVGDGDTLYKIASRYGTTVEAVMAANGFSDRSKILHVGDRLTIP